MLEAIPLNARRRRVHANRGPAFSPVLLALAVQIMTHPAAAQSVPVTDWTEVDLATAGALRDRALKGTSAYDHVSSLTTEATKQGDFGRLVPVPLQ